MKEAPLKNDWSITVKKNMEDIGITLTDEEISKLTKNKFKSIVRSKIRQHVFKEQVDIKLTHSKVRDIVHTNLNTPQEYLKSSTFSK